MNPVVVSTRAELTAARAAAKGSVVLVPTMGALHDGHRSLLATARDEADHVIVTIFVNPLQFGPGEDLDRYPRTFDADLEMCAAEGVDMVFAPTAAEMYPSDPIVTVSGGNLAARFEGASRPGHFDGVLTVVAKLFGLTRPDIAIFGRKDAQQLALIRRMVIDLEMPVAVVGAAIVREPDGLALSSRNRYLQPAERAAALALSQGLALGASVAATGAGPTHVLAAVEAVLGAADGVRTDYVAFVDPDTFENRHPAEESRGLLLVAAKVGTTRLIDNRLVAPAPVTNLVEND